jgi:predicted Zn-dependent protease
MEMARKQAGISSKKVPSCFHFAGKCPTRLVRKTYDPEVMTVDLMEIGARIEEELERIRSVGQKGRMMPRMLNIERCRIKKRVRTSSGLEVTEKGTWINLLVRAIYGGNTVQGECTSRTLVDLDLQGLTRSLRDQVSLCGLGRVGMGKRKIAVAVSPHALRQMLEPIVEEGLTANSMGKGILLGIDEAGDMVFENRATIRDVGALPGGVSSSSFDDEGTPTSDKYLVRKGRVTTFLNNLLSAARTGSSPTGNASRSEAVGPVGVSGTNLVVEGGTRPIRRILEERLWCVVAHEVDLHFSPEGQGLFSIQDPILYHRGEPEGFIREALYVSASMQAPISFLGELSKETQWVGNMKVPYAVLNQEVFANG